MNDLISRQVAIDVLEERLQANGYSNVALVSELNRSIGYLMKLPSAQPEIVRCKDCKWWQMVDKKYDGVYGCCEHLGMIIDKPIFVNEDFFCADGERKEESEAEE